LLQQKRKTRRPGTPARTRFALSAGHEEATIRAILAVQKNEAQTSLNLFFIFWMRAIVAVL